MRWITSCAAVLNISPQQVQTHNVLRQRRRYHSSALPRRYDGRPRRTAGPSIKRMMQDEAVNGGGRPSFYAGGGRPAGGSPAARLDQLAELEDVYAPYKAGRAAPQTRPVTMGTTTCSAVGRHSDQRCTTPRAARPGVLHLGARERVSTRARAARLYWRQSSLTVAGKKERSIGRKRQERQGRQGQGRRRRR